MGIKTISISVDDEIPRKIELSMGGDWEGWDTPCARYTCGGDSYTESFPVSSADQMQDFWLALNDQDTQELADAVDSQLRWGRSVTGVDSVLNRA